jgi:hypothetical protein
MEMRWVACTPEQYKLVFQNIAHTHGFKEVLSAQYDSLLYLFAQWVTDLQMRRMDQYNVRIYERNVERNTMKDQLTQLREENQNLASCNRRHSNNAEDAIRENDKLRSDLALAREALRRAAEAMPDWDCGSNSCRFAKIKGGMRTNGGCTCLEEIRNAPKARMAFARIASVLGTLTTKEDKNG